MADALDDRIAHALASAARAERSQQPATYIETFRESARAKADDVLTQLRTDPPPGTVSKPVFVSIGGGDGTELERLLTQSTATDGLLLEYHRESAEYARQIRISGKTLHVFDGDAQRRLREVMDVAFGLVASKQADFVVATCHAVIHELYDRSDGGFDAARFFSTIFADQSVPTWFTYREPGVPEKWPEEVLLAAKCRPNSLLDLALAIRHRHPKFNTDGLEPHVFGDHVRMHRALAMETVVKLFYLDGLAYELQERSTAVDHQRLESILLVAVGATAMGEGRASVRTISAATRSFVDRWRELGVTVFGYEDERATPLVLPESQTRVIAWRVPQMPTVPSHSTNVGPGVETELAIAVEAYAGKDLDLLLPLLISKGRAWIESPNSAPAIELLRNVREGSSRGTLAWLWSHYLISIANLFAGLVDPEQFSAELELEAQNVGLGLLYRAERMESLRKNRQFDAAAELANSLLPLVATTPPTSETSLQRYARGTMAYVLNNFLRSGGAYHDAWRVIAVAADAFAGGPESHAVELAHCHYARNVCVAMTGIASFETEYSGNPQRRRFAAALILLAYSHASWFTDDVAQAEKFATDAAEAFTRLDTPNYAERARELATLLKWWKVVRAGAIPPTSLSDESDMPVRVLTGDMTEFDRFVKAFVGLRPSRALGLLQFSLGDIRTMRLPSALPLPRTLHLGANGRLEWRELSPAASFAAADTALRGALGIPLERRLPLLAD
jgi:hypothetical protein